VGRVARWPWALAAGWTAFAATAIVVAHLAPSPLAALGLAAGGLLAAWVGLPRAQGAASPPLVPPAELWLRVAAAFALAVAIVWGAGTFGPVVSGILLSVPVTGSIMPPFTLALYGPGALARLMRGFAIGLTGFTAFFFALALALEPFGVGVAFAWAVAAALGAVFAFRYLASRRR
jgi:hypothetical protein